MTARKIGILGAGSWGTALAIQAARTGCDVLLWGHHPQHVATLADGRENKRYLPGAVFPWNLSVSANLQEVSRFSDLLLIAVPSHAFKTTLEQLRPLTAANIRIAWATKGFNPDNGSLLHELVAALFTAQTPAAVLSGPTFAHEVAAELPTAITIASPYPAFSNELTQLFHSNRFRTYTSADIVGVEVGGAVKNVMAIAAGIADGLGFGANTRAALITRGLTEIIRLGLRLGGHQETFMGLAGLGDLILTCTDNQSRNRRLGIALGRGQALQPAMREIGQEIEGVLAAKETYLLSQKHAIDMPITEQTYKVLYEGLSPATAVQNLLSRELKSESTGQG
ncbi:NAD(P)H-dependent glycerol-3-phosphate dehydrogenase [Methylomicrobium sp. Wu6]|uniref:NAD(P)H-dependent glycerol-3-phosphate dehydrogenase n=1 Tax=Methylomicrobium sp. Wu6 TaxID=3107928 RepID=UPI002DD66309|nr:NAD(P)H-dependent glycerol-3-phosphate dehydrogenase [Methylomicrobium sp. Wu6]MEC4749715.1 NAD(P)H-dependent glycerol-3-phosphate dehydrogenase [Methylomicrobium sp. Wu6]